MSAFEIVPAIFGLVVALAAAVLLADALLLESPPMGERRGSARASRSRAGETAIGLALGCIALVLLGSDAWRLSTAVIAIAAVLFVAGAVTNARYLAGLVVGAARRGHGSLSDARVEPARWTETGRPNGWPLSDDE